MQIQHIVAKSFVQFLLQRLETAYEYIRCDLFRAPIDDDQCFAEEGNPRYRKNDKGKGFLVGGILVTSCVSDDDCGLSSLNCIGGFCTTLCSSESNYCNKDTACVSTTDNVNDTKACYIM